VWTGGHDIWNHKYLSSCLEIFEKDPQIVLCYSQIIEIDSKSKTLGIVREGLDTRFLKTFERFEKVITELSNLPICDPIYGIIKSEALRKTRLERNIWGPDHLILLELSFLGSFTQIKEPLYCRRVLPRDLEKVEDWTDRYILRLDPKNQRNKFRITFSQMGFEYLKLVVRSKFSIRQKIKITIDIFHIFWSKYRYAIIYRDIMCGFLYFLFGNTKTYYSIKRYPYKFGKFLRNHL
jgi:hypothetical protein